MLTSEKGRPSRSKMVSRHVLDSRAISSKQQQADVINTEALTEEFCESRYLTSLNQN